MVWQLIAVPKLAVLHNFFSCIILLTFIFRSHGTKYTTLTIASYINLFITTNGNIYKLHIPIIPGTWELGFKIFYFQNKIAIRKQRTPIQSLKFLSQEEDDIYTDHTKVLILEYRNIPTSLVGIHIPGDEDILLPIAQVK